MDNLTVPFYNYSSSSSSGLYNDTSTAESLLIIDTNNYHVVVAIGILTLIFGAIAFSAYVCSIRQYSSVSIELESAYVTVRPGEKTPLRVTFIQPSFGFGFPFVQHHVQPKVVCLSVSLFQDHAPVLVSKRLTLNALATRYVLEIEENLLLPGATYLVRADVIQTIVDSTKTVARAMAESKPVRSTDFHETHFTACMELHNTQIELIDLPNERSEKAMQEKQQQQEEEKKREELFEPY